MRAWLWMVVLATGGLAGGGLGRADEAPKLLPGNAPCAYPEVAQERQIAGPVEFRATVRPDGAVEAVAILKAPRPGVGFEEAVRACVERWRFEPAAGGSAGSREYAGRVRFRRVAAEEAAIRTLLEAIAEAWNAGDAKALRAFEVRLEDVRALPPPEEDSLRHSLEAHLGAMPRWRLELAPDVDAFAFLSGGLADVRQAYLRVRADQREPGVLDLTALKTANGWRVVPVSTRHWLVALPVGGSVPEPRRVKDAKVSYPTIARQARVAGIVILDCLVETDGRVTGIRVLRGIPLLDQAAADAVRQWVFEPTLLNGQAVPVRLAVTVTFRLSCSGAPGPESVTNLTVCG